MRTARLIFALVAIVTGYGCGHLNAGTKAASTPGALPAATNSAAQPRSFGASAADSRKDSATPASVATRVDFPTQIKPILQAKCQPCHFNGGKVYAQMPFDRPETIKTLGTKLFTRIKDENERKLIRDFLAQE
jgi:hypothetical protein